MATTTYDYIIIGGGLAGCVLASRLRESSPNAKLLLIEAGPDTRENPKVQRPEALNLGGELDWAYQSEPELRVGNRPVTVNAGKGLGGGSAINSGAWTRGAAVDFDGWADLVGDQRYSYKGQLPWLKKAENWHKSKSPDHQGQDGPINVVSADAMKRFFPLSDKYAAAWEEQGVHALPNNDQNAGLNLGRAYIAEARNEGKRQYSAKNYSLDGVEIRLETLVKRVILQTNGGQVMATGVELADGTAISAKEVIVSAGALRTPQLLQLSGIGPSEDLRKVGIEPVVDAPDVGKGLSDHMLFLQHWRLRDSSKGYVLGSENPLFAEPQFSQGSPMDWIVCTDVPEDGLAKAIEKDEGVKPDASKHPLLKNKRTFLEYVLLHFKLPLPGIPMDTEHMTTAIVHFLPTSTGSVSLKSSNVEDYPEFKLNYLSTEVDRYTMREGLRKLTQLMLGSSFNEYIVGESIPPGAPIEPVTLEDSDEKVDQRLAATSGTTWHLNGTCAMGKVVDTEFRVRGVEGLRVVDASVFPAPLSAHIQAPLYGLAEQAAFIIAGKA